MSFTADGRPKTVKLRRPASESHSLRMSEIYSLYSISQLTSAESRSLKDLAFTQPLHNNREVFRSFVLVPCWLSSSDSRSRHQKLARLDPARGDFITGALFSKQSGTRELLSFSPNVQYHRYCLSFAAPPSHTQTTIGVPSILDTRRINTVLATLSCGSPRSFRAGRRDREGGGRRKNGGAAHTGTAARQNTGAARQWCARYAFSAETYNTLEAGRGGYIHHTEDALCRLG